MENASLADLLVDEEIGQNLVLLASAWGDGGHGSHYGVITRPIGRPQLSPDATFSIMEHYCRDASSFVDRIELF